MFSRIVKLLSYLLLTLSLFSVEVKLGNISYYPQTWNNCAPASLSMILSFYQIDISQQFIESRIKSNKNDVHISTEELQDFMLSHNYHLHIEDGLSVLDIIEVINENKPVMVPIWYKRSEDDQMGHYIVITGYDDSRKIFYIKDPLDGEREYIPYEEFDHLWKVFNRTILIPDVTAGSYNFENREVVQEPYDFFDWYNLGVESMDHPETALGYFRKALVLEYPERFYWYNTKIFKTLFDTRNYRDIIHLSNETLRTCLAIEEIWYWRAKALYALSMYDEAHISIDNALKYRDSYKDAISFKKSISVNNK